MRVELDKLIRNKGTLLSENYINAQELFMEKYGEKSVILIEIGSFYEVYSTEEVGVAKEIAKELNLTLTKKNKNKPEVSLSNPRLCGVPSVSLDKYLEILVQKEWNVCIVKQITIDGEISRCVDRIITPGTNIDFISSEDEHYLASVSIEQHKNDVLSVGLALFEPTLGKTLVYESHGTKDDPSQAIDEVIELLIKYNVSELIYSAKEECSIFSNFGMSAKWSAKKTLSIDYINQLFNEVFKSDESLGLSPIEIQDVEREMYATEALTRLLQYSISNNKLITNNLSNVIKLEPKSKMELGNNPLLQLDIKNKNLPMDVSRLINKGVSAIGRRFIEDRLINPLKNKEMIEERVSNSLKIEMEIENIPAARKELSNVFDIERIYRNIKMTKAEPSEIYNLYKTILSVQSLPNSSNHNKILEQIENGFIIDKIDAVKWAFWEENLCKNYIGTEVEELSTIKGEIDDFYAVVSSIGVGGKMKHSPSEGLYFEVSNKSDKIQELKDKFPSKTLKSSVKFYPEVLSELSSKVDALNIKIKAKNKIEFEKILNKIEVEDIKSLILDISNFEFALNNKYLRETLNFCDADFIESEENHFDARKLRHPIVEFVDKEEFISNDIFFGKVSQNENPLLLDEDGHQGYILFGQNSSGKTILSKSIGIATILAHCGMLVPAEKLTLSTYDSVFTRIVGSDDLASGKSTFAMEMSELKNILNRAGSKSMVIGDEISHGTETTSGLSIVAATILSLKGSFILSTHLHELDKVERIMLLKHVKMVHLSLSYSQAKDTLTYNRKLQIGKGKSIYGLEFARSIHLPTEFIDLAYEIRGDIDNGISGIENLAKEKSSKYNSKVYYGVCKKCGGKADEIHHIKHQENKDDNGMVDGVKVHSQHNLEGLCKACHKLTHDS